MLGWSSTLGALHDGEPAERINGWRFNASVFRALGVQPQLGRFFTDEDDRMDAPSDVTVISDGLWRTKFASDPQIGVRMALGARRTGVLGLVLRRSVTLTVVGIILGVGGATALTRYIGGLLFDVKPVDTPTFVLVSMLFVAIAALASYVPARRATKIDPLTVLRYE
jgi:hypothetical protein